MSELICGFCNGNLLHGACNYCDILYGTTMFTIRFLFSENKITFLSMKNFVRPNNYYIFYYFFDTKWCRLVSSSDFATISEFTIDHLGSLENLKKTIQKHLKYDYLS